MIRKKILRGNKCPRCGAKVDHGAGSPCASGEAAALVVVDTVEPDMSVDLHTQFSYRSHTLSRATPYGSTHDRACHPQRCQHAALEHDHKTIR